LLQAAAEAAAMVDDDTTVAGALEIEQDDEVLMEGRGGIWPSSDNDDEGDGSFHLGSFDEL
jgi:hypothetical protein